ncbi:MAG: toxin-antitoxin system protein [Armatimonadota bacterium]|nr:toxin-antitoxin system protein [Armatimonadota bacterium]
MATASRTVRIKPETHRKLQKLARETGQSLPDVLDKAISEYERQRFLAECNASYTRLREDPEAWREELEERALWDCTLMDGLKDDPPYPPEAMLTPEERAERERGGSR